MQAARRLLAGAWWREGRRAWLGAAALVAAVVGGGLVAAGLVDGMEAAAQARVADLFTGELRLTPRQTGAAVPERFNATVQAELAALPGFVGRLETQFLLSRRTLLETYLTEDERIEVQAPGGTGSPDAYGLGVLVGIPAGAAATAVEPHLVAGRLPSAGTPVELTLGRDALLGYLDASEQARFAANPTSTLAGLRFEVTSGRVREGLIKDVVRLPAVVVGIWETGLDPLDRYVAYADLDAVRALSSEPGALNAATVHDSAAARQAAAANGWAVDDAPAFTQRSVGQLVEAVRIAAGVLFALLLAFPAALLGLGLRATLESQRREVAVCRAIGVPSRLLRGALLRLSVVVAALGAGGALAVSALGPLLPPLLGSSPLPVAFVWPAAAAIAAVVALAAAALLAWHLATRRHLAAPLAPLLKAF